MIKISRQEYESFKTKILTILHKLSEENEKMANHIDELYNQIAKKDRIINELKKKLEFYEAQLKISYDIIGDKKSEKYANDGYNNFILGEYNSLTINDKIFDIVDNLL